MEARRPRERVCCVRDVLARSEVLDGFVPCQAALALGDVWAHCLPSEPGYWLVPLALGDLDDVWWKILEPHLCQRKFGDAV